MARTWIVCITVVSIFLFPLLYIGGFSFPAIFPHAMFIFFISELLLLLFLWGGIRKQQLVFKKSLLTAGLLAYIVVLFISALAGADFLQSFWSSYSRMTGLVTWVHYFILFFVLSSVLERQDWKYVFRALILSAIVLAIGSFLGPTGFNIGWKPIAGAGSLLGNSSYSGIYYVLVFFMSVVGFALEDRRKWKYIYGFGWLIIFISPDLFNFQFFTGAISFSEIFGNPFLLLGYARASTVALWTGIVLLGILYGIHTISKVFIQKMLLGIVFVCLSGGYVFGFLSIINKQGIVYEKYIEEEGEHIRSSVWNIALQSIKERPWFGYGLENFEHTYQKHLNASMIENKNDLRMVTLRETLWFDMVHNTTLESLVYNGVIGTLTKILLLGIVLFLCMRRYFQKREFYFLVVPFVFILHLLQTQTSFETDSGLLLLFLLLAFLVSREEKIIALSLPGNRWWYRVGAVALFMVTLYSFIFVPIRENKTLANIQSAAYVDKRIPLYKDLYSLRMSPEKSLRILSGKYTAGIVTKYEDILQYQQSDNVRKELNIYLDLYEHYLPRYENSYRYLIDYANVIHIAYLFGINETEKGETLSRRALSISQSYPHAYWFLAFNMYRQERFDEAKEYMQAAQTIDPSIKSDFLYKN
ncbi:hypothetical protein A2738_03815 [Candidatus Nomurabacteria bacterium RIFCSPHIGHO2_01_FULL_42_15]|uniref:O-antigen ligase-related domain-containing protein n=1 Tax=Candidatus Nomurabacteria bacterium RIFCSPHIGHO2_01_FULL_42_15 TaxID=1801742 RepID=A0A1F6VEE6_9BACT|nr:MAG: hypothetical protein A2738_03815 [Candidatus Nomurabacteria bacterium RIFCSPHIGHO2_01_FULL_42_15]OGI93330.1 MAG: hypothetical protein A3A99_03670 [Candidatus Nomurabacteria bacterium RIFCSPLOWO2_01_FULL_41_18]